MVEAKANAVVVADGVADAGRMGQAMRRDTHSSRIRTRIRIANRVAAMANRWIDGDRARVPIAEMKVPAGHISAHHNPMNLAVRKF